MQGVDVNVSATTASEPNRGHALPARELGELRVRNPGAAEDAGVPLALPRRSGLAAGRAEERDVRALRADRRRIVRRVERVAADDRVGERLALLLVVHGRRVAAFDLALADPGRLPAELDAPLGEGDAVLVGGEQLALGL